ncbi:hypothetical protein [Aeromicrobium sp. 179-A 4D2 NHS]|uniref:hypothetical protein n=1 Tax=Aeromicrobium sp. 179-A 4D2 NHS TaxID=3142375 RepID=UPI0039A2B6B2
MANAAKNKGDRAEREACEILKALAPNLCVEGAIRMLGAGRLDDVGDLRVFEDVAVQVRNYKMTNIGGALRSAATDSVIQAKNGRVSVGLGMVPIPGARKTGVRWLASCMEWPMPLWEDGGLIDPTEFKMVSKAIDWLRDEKIRDGVHPVSRELRVARLLGRGTPVYVAPIEAWLAAYAVSIKTPLFAETDDPFDDPFGKYRVSDVAV